MTASTAEVPFFQRELETTPRERLRALQWQRVTALAREVFPANPFIKRKWEAAGLRSVEDLRSWEDFYALPFTTKSEYVVDQAERPPFGTNLTYPVERYVRVHQTSGTTGLPIRWLDTKESWNWLARCWCYALRLIEVGRERGIDLPNSSIRITVHAAEPGASIPATRKRLEEGWGARCFDHAGMSEVGPFSFECVAPAGPHLIESEFIAEVIDPTTLKPAQRGELVLTNLGRTGSPVFRYRSGDLVQLAETPCVCGRSFYRLEGGILGRLDDMLIVRGVNVFPAAIEGIVRRFAAVDEFQIEVSRDGELDEVCVLLEAGDEAVVRAVREALRAGLGIRLEARAVPPRSLPRFELKARRVVRR